MPDSQSSRPDTAAGIPAPAVPAVMFQGTGSDVGKSLLVAGLARAFTARGMAVRPFKPQNMSNNAAVTTDGNETGEIGRAQALQARACGVPPSVHMNPVLLKPQSEVGAQIVVQGRVVGNAKARDYQAMKPGLMPAVLDSFARLGRQADLLLVEGAGSAAEVNLRAGDIANMGFAEAADVPVVLIGDIDRGGVIASIVGTWALLPPAERARLKGYVINKFRGDPALFDSGIARIEAETGLKCLGVIPWFADASRLPAEDAMALEKPVVRASGSRPIRIAVPRVPRIANFDDFDPLAAEADVELIMVPRGRPLPDCDLIILPGSKATLADLADLEAEGWDLDVKVHHRRGGRILGICGGYQMLGASVADPHGIEGPAGERRGLGLLDVATVLEPSKHLRPVTGEVEGAEIAGYEMHMGVTTGADTARPFATLEGSRPDGARSADGLVAGTYVHGIFARDGYRSQLLQSLRPGRTSDLAWEASVEATLDRLGAHLAAHVDLDALLEIARSRCA